MAKATATIDHETIRNWVEERGGCPARVKGTGSDDDLGIVRIDYPGYGGVQTLEQISWDAFFEAFEANELAFLYQDEKNSRFSKLIARDSADLDADAGRTAGGKKRGRSAGGVDAIELLEQQHREMEELFEKLRIAKSDSQKERMFVELANALAAHTKVEETMFYPTVFDEDTEEELRESFEEHLVAKRLLADILDLQPSDPQFMSKVAVLEEVIALHIQKEEGDLFVAVREQDTEDLMLLGKKMQERYRHLLEGEPKDEIPEETDTPNLPF